MDCCNFNSMIFKVMETVLVYQVWEVFWHFIYQAQNLFTMLHLFPVIQSWHPGLSKGFLDIIGCTEVGCQHIAQPPTQMVRDFVSSCSSFKEFPSLQLKSTLSNYRRLLNSSLVCSCYPTRGPSASTLHTHLATNMSVLALLQSAIAGPAVMCLPTHSAQGSSCHNYGVSYSV